MAQQQQKQQVQPERQRKGQQSRQSRRAQASVRERAASEPLSENGLSVEALEAMGPEAAFDLALAHLTASARQLEEMVEDNRASLAEIKDRRARIDKLNAGNGKALSRVLESLERA